MDKRILFPMFVMILLTLKSWLIMFVFRVRFILKNKIQPETIDTRSKGEKILEPVQRYANNFSNLLELPMLFYAITIIIFVTNQNVEYYLFYSWVFAVCRIFQALVHVTFNNVNIRFFFYLISSLSLWFMWIHFMIQNIY
jgi:hypothetical protein